MPTKQECTNSSRIVSFLLNVLTHHAKLIGRILAHKGKRRRNRGGCREAKKEEGRLSCSEVGEWPGYGG